MSENLGYENVPCQLKFKGCEKKNAGYQRRARFAQEGPWLDACENCARVPYEQPAQFQEGKKNEQDVEDPATVAF